MIGGFVRSSRRPRYSAFFRHAFAVYVPGVFRFQGNKYRFGPADARVKQFLHDLVAWRDAHPDCTLLAFRKDLRDIVRARPIRGLIWCAIFRDGPLRNVAVWLLGRIRNRHTLRVLTSLAHDADERVRKDVAKALRRMGAWRSLRELEHDPSPLVRRIAADRSAEPYRRRLERFLQDDVTSEPVEHTSQRLFVALDRFEGRAPRSAGLIRQVLRRIHWLVHSPSRTISFWRLPRLWSRDRLPRRRRS